MHRWELPFSISRRRLQFAGLGATVLALMLVPAAAASSAAKTVKCGSYTVPATVTKQAAIRVTDITAHGVSCKDAKTVIAAGFKPNGTGPKGWKITIHSLGGKKVEDVLTHRSDKITFRFIKES